MPSTWTAIALEIQRLSLCISIGKSKAWLLRAITIGGVILIRPIVDFQRPAEAQRQRYLGGREGIGCGTHTMERRGANTPNKDAAYLLQSKPDLRRCQRH